MPLLELPERAELKENPVVASGFRPLDRLLPRGGVARGSLVEWLADDEVSGATALAAAVAVSLAGAVDSGAILVVDRGGRFHPPAVMPWLAAATTGSGDASRPQCIVARPARDDDEVWTLDQALRCPGITAVLAWPRQVHPTAMRRWQLAARSSQAVGLLVRPGWTRREPSWAMHRIAVTPMADGSLGSRRLQLSLLDGPWSAAGLAGSYERSVEVVLDLVRGCEAAGSDQRLMGMSRLGVSRHFQPSAPLRVSLPSPDPLLSQEGGLVCRAS